MFFVSNTPVCSQKVPSNSDQNFPKYVVVPHSRTRGSNNRNSISKKKMLQLLLEPLGKLKKTPTFFIYWIYIYLICPAKTQTRLHARHVTPPTSVTFTKIQLKDRVQPPVEKNYTDLDKVLSELFRTLVKNDLLLFLVVFSSFKVMPSFQKIDYHLQEVLGKSENQRER